MSWHLYARSAEAVLESARLPSSEELISLIKRVNPTSLNLSEADREQGYSIKNRLQNLLLENYGDAFHLAPHPCSPDIVLIKHNSLPSIDACHTDLGALSAKALDATGQVASPVPETAPKGGSKRKRTKAAADCSPKQILTDAELLLEHYEYPQAEEMLASLRISGTGDLPTLLRAAEILGEMGAFQGALGLLQAQPKQVLKDKEVRELLALTYYGNGMIAEARSLFDVAHPADLGKKALYAYADIALKDGNPTQAYHLLKLSDSRQGFVTTHASLRKEVEAAMLQEAEPFFREALTTYQSGDRERTERLLAKAISLCPNFQKAHQLAAEIEAGRSASELGRLWERFESASGVEERLELLAQLLERDKGNGDKIKSLVALERSKQKRQALEARMEALRVLLAQERWGDCFDLLLWLSREGDDGDFGRACQLAPYFSVLHRNARLLRLPGQEAKELWLRLVALKHREQQGPTEGCWEQLQDLKQYFHPYPLFKEEYDRALELEQVKAREEVKRLLARLDELDELEEEEESRLPEARKVAARMRKLLIFLPAAEAVPYRQHAKYVLRRLAPEMDEWGGIYDYQQSLLLGNCAKARQLRERQQWPEQLVQTVESEIAEQFAISAEPMTLTISPDLVVDLGTESAPGGLLSIASTEHHMVLREDGQTLIVINLQRMSATRYRSPNFQNLTIMDALPDQDLFLFIDTTNDKTMWRARFAENDSRFTAVFDIDQHFSYGQDARLETLLMSGSRDNCYYALLQDIDGPRFVKQQVSLTSNLERSFGLTGEAAGAFRLSYHPERFVVITDSTTTVLENNLTMIRGGSRAGASQTLHHLGQDTGKGLIYAFGDGLVNVLNPQLRAVKQYLNAASAAYMIVTKMAQICVERHTALLNVGGSGVFYNMQTNKFSQKFSVSRLLRTDTPSRWYYWDYHATDAEILLKDITDEVDTLLQWQVLLAAEQDGDEEATRRFAEGLNDPRFFSIVRPADPAQSPDPS